MSDVSTKRYFSRASRQSLLRLIAERMEIPDGDLVARTRWAERVRREWPTETHSGRLEVSLDELLRRNQSVAVKCG